MFTNEQEVLLQNWRQAIEDCEKAYKKLNLCRDAVNKAGLSTEVLKEEDRTKAAIENLIKNYAGVK